MFCSKCGTECDDGVSFCPKCGSMLNSNDTHINEKSNTVNSPAKSPLKLILFLIIIVAIITTGIILLSDNDGYSSPEKLAKAYVEATFELDSEKMVSCLPDFLVESSCNSHGLANASRKELAKVINNEIEELEQTKQKVKIISININRELSTGYDMFDYFGVPSDEKEKISRVVELNVKFSLDNENDEEIVEMVCFEEFGKWYILNID